MMTGTAPNSAGSDSTEPWDERGDKKSALGTSNNKTNTNKPTGTTAGLLVNTTGGDMRRDRFVYDEPELEDGDLPRLNISTSAVAAANANRERKKLIPPTTNATTSTTESNLRKTNSDGSELRRQREFWKQLDSPSSLSNDEEARKARNQRNETKDNKRTAKKQAKTDKRDGDYMERLRRTNSDDSDDTRETKEFIVGEADNNFCEHTLSAMEAICGDNALQAFCGGVPNTPATTGPPGANSKLTDGSPARPKRAKNLNILNAKGDGDAVDEHTAIEVEYVEPEDTNGIPQDRPENWSPSRKNAYLAAMARKAKEDFEKNQAMEVAAQQAPKPQKRSSNPAATETADNIYNSFNAAEKRKFLRLINSGMTPKESADRVGTERDKAKESKPKPKKGKMFKFWKKGSSKAKANDSTDEEQNISMQEHSPVEPFPQEEKKEDDGHFASDERGLLEKEEAMPSPATATATSIPIEYSSSSESGPAMQSHESRTESDEDDDRRESESESTTGESKPSSNDKSQDRSLNVSDATGIQTAFSEDALDDSAVSPVKDSDSLLGITTPPPEPIPSPRVGGGDSKEDSRDVATTSEPSDDDKESSTSDARFAVSGINYYDAVRRDVFEAEPEDELESSARNASSLSRNRSSSQRSSRLPVVGPILPKLQGFAKLPKGGSKSLDEDNSSRSRRDAKFSEPVTRASSPKASTVTPDTTTKTVPEATPKDMNPSPKPLELLSTRVERMDANSTMESIGNEGPVAETKSEEEALGNLEDVLLRPFGGNTLSSGQKVGKKDAMDISQMDPSPRLVTPPVKSKKERPNEAFFDPPSTNRSQTARTPKSASAAIDTGFDIHEYLSATEGYSHAGGDANESMSVVSGKSYSTNDTGVRGAGSVYTQSSTLTTSSRKRRPGAAKSRLAKAKEAEKHSAKKQGWHESIRAAAESTKRVWKPKLGWVDYKEPATDQSIAMESMDRSIADSTPQTPLLSTSTSSVQRNTDTMHLKLPISKKKKPPLSEELPFANSSAASMNESVAESLFSAEEAPSVRTMNLSPPNVPVVKKAEEAIIDSRTASQSNVNRAVLLEEPPIRRNPLLFEDMALSNTPEGYPVPPQHKGPTDSKRSNIAAVARPTLLDDLPADEFDASRAEFAIHGNKATSAQHNQEGVASIATEALPEIRAVTVTGNEHESSVPINSAEKQTQLDSSYLDTTGDSSIPPPPPAVPASIDDISIEQSVAYSVEQFVQSVGTASPARSSRRKPQAVRSPNRALRANPATSKQSGWVDSMRAATANIAKDRQVWDPVSGWTEVSVNPQDGPVEDDLSTQSYRQKEKRAEPHSLRNGGRIQANNMEGTLDDSNITKPSIAAERVKQPLGETSLPAHDSALQGSRVDHYQMDVADDGGGGDTLKLPPSRFGSKAKAGKHDKVPLLDPAKGFPSESVKMTPTVNVVKEKVDEEDRNWFPESRRSSAKAAPTKQETAKPVNISMDTLEGTISTNSPKDERKRGPVDVDTVDEVYDEDGLKDQGLIWNGVVFESDNQDSHVQAPAISPTLHEAPQNQAGDSPKSGSTVASLSQFSKIVPKLTSNRRDTTPMNRGGSTDLSVDSWSSPTRSRTGDTPSNKWSDQASSPEPSTSPGRLGAEMMNDGLRDSHEPPEARFLHDQRARDRGASSNYQDRNLGDRNGGSNYTENDHHVNQSTVAGDGGLASEMLHNGDPTSFEERGGSKHPTGNPRRYENRGEQSRRSPIPAGNLRAFEESGETATHSPLPAGNPRAFPESRAETARQSPIPTGNLRAFDQPPPPPPPPPPANRREFEGTGIERRTHPWSSSNRPSRTGNLNAGDESNTGGRPTPYSQRRQMDFDVHPVDVEPTEGDSESQNVRHKAQQWESRSPTNIPHGDRRENPDEKEQNRLNAATAEWKSFLGKKVQAESAAAEQHGLQLHHLDHQVDPKMRRPLEQNDSIFEFSLDETSVESDNRSQPQRRDYQGNNPMESSRDVKNISQEVMSDYSDGNEINKSFLTRLAGCAAPMMPKRGQGPAAEAMAHLSFLRTNPKVDKSARFMPPYLCGRPDVIIEERESEGDGDEQEGGAIQDGNGLSREDLTTHNSQQGSRGVESKGGATPSVISDDFGAKTAYLEALAMKTAVSKPRKSDKRRKGSSAASDVSTTSTQTSHREKWRDFLDKRGVSPGKQRPSGGSETSTVTAAEKFAANQVNEMMALMASRSKTGNRSSWRNPEGAANDKRSQVIDKMIRDHDEAAGSRQQKSDSVVAAEQLASARVNAMLTALAQDSPPADQGEI
ncbi:expressed unknown protein [Seminavis robusta]|uniref:Uncharacterized protein n=1 Tax=Seminavis robusta TaxID=568900 RepID=A0A9N8HNB5_9STRA|nr:expressed unknown protein [Seminavis robusta]|eukprot:Sro972_g226630.1 n/a (2282) ;mRNA; r:27813-34658